METRKKSDLLRTFVKGGFISPADLLKILDVSKSNGNKYVLFGSRQDILFPVPNANNQKLESDFSAINLKYELGSDHSVYQNIVTSYAAVNLVDTTHWVKEDTYNVITDSFDYVPKLKINIVDPIQSLVPLFTGELNFIASQTEHYWYLYVRDSRKGGTLERWPRLINSQDIPKLSKAIEDIFLKYLPFTAEELYMIIRNEVNINHKPLQESVRLGEINFPSYEGFNAMMNNQLWLGLYWRNNQYDIDFMNAACRLCQETNISNINIIPWKAFIIKGIKPSDKLRWEKLMGKFGINERHSSLELNWHLPVIDQDALELKRFLVKELDQQDINTHGLTFAIKTGRDTFPFTTIVIETETDHYSSHDLYTISYAKNFNPKSTVYFPYARHVEKEMIPALLIELSKLYFRQLNPEKEKTETPIETSADPKEPSAVFQCPNCLTIYDALYGDPDSGISAGVKFENLPEDYKCRVCESPKRIFTPIKMP